MDGLRIFGINAGVASLNNVSTEIFHAQLPYYFQGVSLVQKIIGLIGVFVLGAGTILARRVAEQIRKSAEAQNQVEFSNKPLTNIGFIALLIGVVLGLAQYSSTAVFASLILLLAGAMLYPTGRLTENVASDH